MSYPEKTEYQGYVIYKHDPAYQANSYQVYTKDGNPVSMLCATMADAKSLIHSYKSNY
ncbi:hypothetical protein D3C86_1957790 [compost metagenome]|jgi:hypothetical protein